MIFPSISAFFADAHSSSCHLSSARCITAILSEIEGTWDVLSER
jgi:hypothetical protein